MSDPCAVRKWSKLVFCPYQNRFILFFNLFSFSMRCINMHSPATAVAAACSGDIGCSTSTNAIPSNALSPYQWGTHCLLVVKTFSISVMPFCALNEILSLCVFRCDFFDATKNIFMKNRNYSHHLIMLAFNAAECFDGTAHLFCFQICSNVKDCSGTEWTRGRVRF